MTGVILCDNKFGRPCLGTCFVATNSLVVIAPHVALFMYRNVWDVEQMTCHGSRGPLTADIRLRFDDSSCGVCVGQNVLWCEFSQSNPLSPVCILPPMFYVHYYLTPSLNNTLVYQTLIYECTIRVHTNSYDI
jgi:hypothetical protein